MPEGGSRWRLIAAAAAIVVGGLTAVTTTPRPPTPESAQSSPVQLLASPLQDAINQLLAAEQQVIATNSAYPFIVPSDLTRLPTYVQNLALTLFAVSLIQQTNTQLHNLGVQYGPYVWNAPAAEPQGFITIPNPDNLYSPLTIDSTQTYVVTIDPGPATQDMTFTPNAGNGATADFTPLKGGIDLANATPNADGSYTIIFSPTQPSGTPSGNWVDITGADRVIVRDTLGSWGQIHDSISIQQEGVPATNTLPQLSDDQIASLVNTVAANLVAQNAAGTYYNTQKVFAELPDNSFSKISTSLSHVPALGELGSVLPGQVSSGGHFVLEPDQALIVKVPDVQSSYSGFEVADVWSQNVPYATVQGSLNNTQAFHASDGFTYYVISSQNPGVANWVDDSGINNGEVFLRWQNVTGPVPTTPITATVVPVADVKDQIGNLLPADTPLVTPAEYAVDIQQRLFDYDYALDQTHSIAWVGINLELDQLKAAMGADQFSELFGGQTDVPSVAHRLAPALTPNLLTLADHLLTHPGGTLTALGDNLPLAIQDIELPTILAIARLRDLFEQGGAGLQGLGAVVNQTLTDPATSITAGMLNARDDLAVAIMNASSSTAPTDTLWNTLSELNHALAQTLSNALDPAAAAPVELLP